MKSMKIKEFCEGVFKCFIVTLAIAGVILVTGYFSTRYVNWQNNLLNTSSKELEVLSSSGDYNIIEIDGSKYIIDEESKSAYKLEEK